MKKKLLASIIGIGMFFSTMGAAMATERYVVLCMFKDYKIIFPNVEIRDVPTGVKLFITSTKEVGRCLNTEVWAIPLSKKGEEISKSLPDCNEDFCIVK